MSKESAGGETVPDEWGTLSDRLRWAIERQPKRGRERGVRLFQRRIHKRAEELDAEGGSPLVGYHLSSIQGYLAGETDPSLPFLREAARLLNVREAWLISGEGAPTEAMEVERLIHDQSEGEWPTWLAENVLWSRLGMGGKPPGRAARSAVLSLWTEIADRRASWEGLDPFEVVTFDGKDFKTVGGGIAQLLAQSLRSPLMELDDHWSALSREAWDTYLVLVSEGLRQYLRASWKSEDQIWEEGRFDDLRRTPGSIGEAPPTEEAGDAEEV